MAFDLTMQKTFKFYTFFQSKMESHTQKFLYFWFCRLYHKEFNNINISDLLIENGVIYDVKGVLERNNKIKGL